jgi:hypothetical protein
MVFWKRTEPHWKGEYKSELGRIYKKQENTAKEGIWVFVPRLPEATTHKTLKLAKEFAETVVVSPGQTAAIGTSRIENSGDN